MRLENLADRFDGSDDVKYINVTQLAVDFFQEANVNSPAKFEIRELALGGNQLLAEQEAYKNDHLWHPNDEENGVVTSVWNRPDDQNGLDGVSLEPQRIRLFQIDYLMGQTQPQKKKESPKVPKSKPAQKLVEQEATQDPDDLDDSLQMVSQSAINLQSIAAAQ